MSLFDLTGKVAVITGSTRGIGRAIAEEYAAHGANVVISSRKSDVCREVAAAINCRYGTGRAIAAAANISSKTAIEELLVTARAAFGQIDILVCNAASNPYFGSMDGISDEQFRKIFENNVMSAHWLIQLVLPEMRLRSNGVIILIASIGGLRGSPTLGAYNISKAADFQLVRNYAVENGEYNIRVNAVAPGLIRSDFSRALWDDPNAQGIVIRATPLRRIGEPRDIAGAAVFLASEAGNYVTGQMIVVDGGRMA